MSILPSSIAQHDHLRVFDEVAEERFDNLDTGLIITFLMNSLAETAIGTMGFDLGVSGVGGLAQAQTVAERRLVLQNAIKTRKRIGTPGAIKDAIVTLGYSVPVIIEGYGNAPVTYSGTSNYTGAINYNGGNNGWAQFVVVLPEAELIGLTASQIAELVQYVNHYKNARSKLVGIGYYDSLLPEYDGLFTYDGSADFSGLPTNTIIFVT